MPLRWIIRKGRPDFPTNPDRPWQLWLSTGEAMGLKAERSSHAFCVQVMDRLECADAGQHPPAPHKTSPEDNVSIADPIAISAQLREIRDLKAKLAAAKAVLADRERELLELKGTCSTCRLHYAHSGPCDIPDTTQGE